MAEQSAAWASMALLAMHHSMGRYVKQHSRAYNMRQHSTVQHSTAQHSTAQRSTAQHSTTQHNTARLEPAAS